MKKIISIILTLAMCISLCSCACSNKAAENPPDADFSRTAGVWREGGANETPALVMDGAGAVTSLYPDGTTEFDGYLGYDAKEDCYAIYTDSDEFITNFTFDSDMQFHIGDDTTHIYVKSDEALTVPMLVSDNALPGEATLDEEPGDGYYFLYLSDDEQITTVNSCFASEMSKDEIIESYIVNCIAELSEDNISDVKIEENIEYTSKIGEHVYLVSWVSRDMQWHSFFFMTNMHTYMYSLYAPVGVDIPYESVFDGLHLTEE